MKNRIDNHSVVKKTMDQVSCDMAGEAVVLNMKSGMYYGMDHVGALVWNLLDEPRTIKFLRDRVLEEYEVTEDSCERDLLTFLKDMESAGLIEIAHEANT